LFGLFILAIAIIAAASYMSSLAFPAMGSSAADVRFALLAVVTMYLLIHLPSERHREPLLEAMVEIRRALAMGDLDLSTATNRARIVLQGMAVADWVREDVRALMEDYDQLLASQRGASELAQLAHAELAALEQSAAEQLRDPAKAQAIRERLGAIERLVEEVAAREASMRETSIKIAGRYGYASRDATEADHEYRARVDAFVTDAIGRNVRLGADWQTFRDNIEQRLRACGY
jgi:hypothetical protein